MTAQETAADAPDPASSALAADDPAGGRLLTPTFVLIVLAYRLANRFSGYRIF